MSVPADPPWLAHARTLIGTREIPGSKHSPVIMGWIRKLGAKVLGIAVKDDETVAPETGAISKKAPAKVHFEEVKVTKQQPLPPTVGKGPGKVIPDVLADELKHT